MSMPSTDSPPRRLRALVVDDEPAVRLALRHAMDGEDWDVELAESAQEALQALKDRRPHVIIADKNMPGMSGIELLRRVRDQLPDVAFVMITGFGNLDSAHEAIRLDVDGYIEKPFRDVFATLDSIRRYVSRRESLARIRDTHAHFSRAAAQQQEGAMIRIDLSLEATDHERMARALRSTHSLIVTEHSKDDAEIVITDPERLDAAAARSPHAILAVAARATPLPMLLALIDQGANAVIDLGDSDEGILESLAPLMRRAQSRRPTR